MRTRIKTHAVWVDDNFKDSFIKRVENALEKYGEQIRNAEIHLEDENSHKGGKLDKRCMIEVHAAGLEPVVVKDYAPTIQEAAAGAIEKLQSALESRIGKMKEHR
jgi:ribosome-associated translation inhibitor RaiA